MASAATGPGKTSPRLLADFLAFDPLASGRTNILADPAPIQGEVNYTVNQSQACKHEYITKAQQSSLPPLDDRATTNTCYKIAVICKKCRLHADVSIDYRYSSTPCPTSEFPLHHLQRTPGLDTRGSAELKTVWQCSSPACSASLSITNKIQRLHKDDVLNLTDTGRLKQRYDDVLKLNPERDGIRQTTPIEAVTRLRRYIKDALNPEHNKRVFPAANKRFMEAFGVYGRDCAVLLQDLGFVYSEQEMSWTLPDPGDDQQQRELLEDVEIELLAVADKIAKEMNVVNPAAGEPMTSAARDLERVMAAQGYHKHVSGLRGPSPALQEAYFASLGALPTFADSLIVFCFDRQMACDAERQAYYFECLREIASSRNSEELHIKTSILASQGLLSRRELIEAYRYFGLNHDRDEADESRIINIYQARQSDLSAAEAERSREMLYKIGSSRGSKLLMNAAQQKIETVDEALAWLGNGVDKDTTDEALLNILIMRVDNDKSKEEIGRKAIEVIAKSRHSQQLRTWLETGRTDGYTMGTDEALRHLNISEQLEKVDPTLWPTIFDNARADRPGAQTEKAIEAVQQALAGFAPGQSAANWPVGLTSLGNTCYLNSLLQYYFSIKPLRDIVLNYDQYKFDLSNSAKKTERVGQRQIDALEVKGGQKFAEDLRHLFQRMISDPASSVKPEQDLVCRAFLDPEDSDLWDNQTKMIEEEVIEDTKHVEDATGASQLQPPIEPEPSQESINLIDLESQPVEQSSESATDTLMQGGPPMTPPASPSIKPAIPSEKPPPLPARKFSTTTNAALARAQSNATQQQDVTEVHDGIQFRLRAGLRADGQDSSGEQLDELLRLFSIHLAETTIKDGTALKPQALTDSAIQLDVLSAPTDIYAALDAVFDLQPVDGSEHLARYRSITRLPPFLQINIPRVGFDKVKGEQFKSEHSIKLVDELYLDRYHSQPDDTLLKKREMAWEWRRELSELSKEQAALAANPSGLTGPEAMSETAEYLERLSDANEGLEELGVGPIDHDAELAAALRDLASEQAKRSGLLRERISRLQQQIDDTFQGYRDIKYRLQAVFFHRGKTAHGHYWISIRDFSTGMWRRYNDERVEEIPEDKWNEIFEANEWAHGTPTYAVYVRDDIKADVVEPVCRQLQQPTNEQNAPAEVVQDTEMA